MPTPTVPRASATQAEWHAWSHRLSTPDRVHRPSQSSALLASTLGDGAGRSVVDAGCGSGLITIAALAAGASAVIALDSDPVALEITRGNVARLLGSDALARVELVEADFSALATWPADLVAVDPPQRPARILDAVEPHQRHLHAGGGDGGLATLRLVLAHAASAVVRTTAADVLPIETVASGADGETPDRWSAPRLVASTRLAVHPAWQPMTGPVTGVGVWDFTHP